PNDLGQATVAVLPFLLAFWSAGRLSRNLLLVVAPALFLLYGVYLTRSRGAMISILVVLVVALYDRFGRLAALLAAGAAGAEVGLVGYCVWLAIVVMTWLQVSAVARLEPATPEDEALVRWAAAARYALTAFVAAAFFLSRTYGVMLFLMLGLAAAVVDLARA